MLSYYRGRISNQRYNDDTGDAILISFENSVIRTFYNGHFTNGNFHDTRPFDSENVENNAFWITFDNRNSPTQYLFYTGPFSSGAPSSGESGVPINNDIDPTDLLPYSLSVHSHLLRWKAWQW